MSQCMRQVLGTARQASYAAQSLHLCDHHALPVSDKHPAANQWLPYGSYLCRVVLHQNSLTGKQRFLLQHCPYEVCLGGHQSIRCATFQD